MREPYETNQPSTRSRKNRGRATIWFGAVILALTFYVGSIGPAYRLTGFQLNGIETATGTQRACEILYWPIYRVCRGSKVRKTVVSRYLSLWALSHRSGTAGATAPAVSHAGESRTLPN